MRLKVREEKAVHTHSLISGHPWTKFKTGFV